MRLLHSISRHRLICALLFDALSLGVFYYYIPHIRRPFEVMLGLVAGLAILTALAARKGLFREAAIVVALIALPLCALELCQKYFDILGVGQVKQSTFPVGEGDYAWNAFDPATHIAAKARALRDGIPPEALEIHKAGDIFAGMDQDRLWKMYKRDTDRGRVQDETGLKKPYVGGPPLGYEMTPDNTFRYYETEIAGGEVISDAKVTVDSYGLRETRGNPESGEVYAFFGCSFMFGTNINDDETLPHFFSEAMGFEKRVVNLGVAGYGPHQALRELEIDYHLGKMGIGKGRVKGVYYLLIDDHPRRVVTPPQDDAPYYLLEGDRARYKGGYREYLGRFGMMMERSRIYPILRQRLYFKMEPSEFSWQWATAVAVLAEMDRLSRERYGVPLGIIYWGSSPTVMEKIRGRGLALVPVADAFEGDWPAMAIKYNIFDSHPSRYANRLLARHLHALVEKGWPGREPERAGTEK